MVRARASTSPASTISVATRTAFTMAVSFDEFAVAWFVSGLNETLPVKILGFLQGQVSPRINAIGSLAFISSMTLIILAQLLLRSPEDKK